MELKGKLSIAKFMDEVKAVAKDNKELAAFMAKGTVSASTIAKFADRIEPDRIRHILDGDSRFGTLTGGHRFGQAERMAKSGKSFGSNHTEFPESWSDDKILESVLKVVNSPQSNKFVQPDGKIRLDGVVDGQTVRTVIDPISNKIITGFPLN